MKKTAARKTITFMIALILIFCPATDAVFAQANPRDSSASLLSGDVKGFNRSVFDSHFSRADRELTPDRWLEQAKQGISQAVYSWELIACGLYDNPLLFEEAKIQLDKWSAAELEKRFTVWLMGRFFGKAAEKALAEFSILVGDVQKNYCWWIDDSGNIIFDDYTGDPAVIRPGDDGREFAGDLLKWRGDVGSLVKTNISDFNNALVSMFPELLAYIPEELRENMNSLIMETGSRMGEKIKREFENIAAREERIFTSRRTRDIWSLRKKNENESAQIFTERLISETEETWNKGIEELNVKIETASEAVSSGDGDLGALGEEWLRLYREQFDRGLKAWEEAEERFFVRRIEWEQESIMLYSQGMEIWNDAYNRFEEQYKNWELSAKELFLAGENIFKNISANLEKNISDAKREFDLNMTMRVGAGTAKVKALIDMYLVCSSASIAAMENARVLLNEMNIYGIDPLDANFLDMIDNQMKNDPMALLEINANRYKNILSSHNLQLSYMEKALEARKAILADYAELIGTGALKDVLAPGASSGDFHLDEYQIALIRAQALVIYWERKTSIAEAVMSYAQELNAGRMTDAEGIRLWEYAKTNYNNSLEAYKINLKGLNDIGAGILEKQTELDKLAREMADAEEKLMRLTNDYSMLLAASCGDISKYILDSLNGRYDLLVDEYKMFLTTGKDAVYKDVIENGMRWGISEDRQKAQGILDVFLNGDAVDILSLSELEEKALVNADFDNSLRLRLAGIDLFSDSTSGQLRSVNSAYSGADWYYRVKGLDGSPSDRDRASLYGEKLFQRLEDDYKNSSKILLEKRLDNELDYLLRFISTYLETVKEPDEYIISVSGIYEIFFSLKERIKNESNYYTDNDGENELIRQFLGGASFNADSGRLLADYFKDNEYCYMLLNLYTDYAAASSFTFEEKWNDTWESLKVLFSGYSLVISGNSLPDIKKISDSIFKQPGDFVFNTAKFLADFSGCFNLVPVWLENEINAWKGALIEYIASYALYSRIRPQKSAETLSAERAELEKKYMEFVEKANSIKFADSKTIEEINSDFSKIMNDITLLMFMSSVTDACTGILGNTASGAYQKHWREFINSEDIKNFDNALKGVSNYHEGILADSLFKAVFCANRVNSAFALFADKESYSSDDFNPLLGEIYNDSVSAASRRFFALTYQFNEIDRLGRAYDISKLSAIDANAQLDSKRAEMIAQETVLTGVKNKYFLNAEQFRDLGIKYDAQYNLLKDSFNDTEQKRFEYEKQDAIRRWASTAYLGIDMNNYDNCRKNLEKAEAVLLVLRVLFKDESVRVYNDSEYNKFYSLYEQSLNMKLKTLEAIETISHEFNQEKRNNEQLYRYYSQFFNNFASIDKDYSGYILPDSKSSWSVKDIITLNDGRLAFLRDDGMILSGLDSEKAGILDDYFNKLEIRSGEYIKTSQFEKSLESLAERMAVYFSDYSKFSKWSYAREYLIKKLIQENSELEFLESFYDCLVFAKDDNKSHPFSSIPYKTGDSISTLYGFFSGSYLYKNADDFFCNAWDELSAEEKADLEFYIILTLTGNGYNAGFSQIYNNVIFVNLYNNALDQYYIYENLSKKWYFGPFFVLNCKETMAISDTAQKRLKSTMEETQTAVNEWVNGLNNNLTDIFNAGKDYYDSCGKLSALEGKKENGQRIEWDDINISLSASRRISRNEISELKTYWNAMMEKDGGSYYSTAEALSALYKWANDSAEENRNNLENYWLAVMQNQMKNENDYRTAKEKFLNGEISAGALKEAAVKAYGANTASRKFHYDNMHAALNEKFLLYPEMKNDHYLYFNVLGGEIAAVTEKVLENRYSAELAAREIEWNQSRYDILSKYNEWQINAGKILENGRREWNISRKKLEDSFRQWGVNFQDEYNRVRGEWNEAYLAGLFDKEKWLERAETAFNQASAESLLTLVGAEAERLALFMDTREPFGIRGAEVNTETLMTELLQSSGITGMMTAFSAVNGVSGTAASVVRRGMGGASVWDAALARAAASDMAKKTNEEIADMEAKRIAVNAISVVDEAKQSLTENVKSANDNFQKSMDNQFILGGFWGKSGNNYIKDIIEGSTLFEPVISRTVEVTGYKNYEMETITLNANLSESYLTGLNSLAINALLDSVFAEIQEIASEIFGIDKDIIIIKKQKTISGETIDLDERQQTPGLFGAHIGYNPAVNPESKSTSRKGIFYDEGEGELGRLLTEYIFWSVIDGRGMAEISLPAWDKRIWNDQGKSFDAPTIRGLSSLHSQIVGTVAGMVAGAIVTYYSGSPILGSLANAAVQWTTNATDSLFFAVLDTGLTDKDNKEIWANFGKEIAIDAAVSSINFAAGAASFGLSSLTSDIVVKALIQGATAAVGSYTSSVAVSYINAYDFYQGTFDADAAHGSWTNPLTISGAASAGITAGLSAGVGGMVNSLSMPQQKILGDIIDLNISGIGKFAEYQVFTAFNLGEGMNMGESMKKAFDDMGGLTFNVANLASIFDFALSTVARNNTAGIAPQTEDGRKIFNKILNGLGGTGFLEVNFGSGGVSGQFGSNGFDVGGVMYNLAKRGIDYAGMIKSITDKNKRDTAIKAYGYGDWTAENTSMRIAGGLDKLVFDPDMIENGLTVLRDGGKGRMIMIKEIEDKNINNMALALIHEAYRDGIVTNDNYIETRTAVYARMEAASAMLNDQLLLSYDSKLLMDILAYMHSNGNMDLFNRYIDENYNSGMDYYFPETNTGGNYQDDDQYKNVPLFGAKSLEDVKKENEQGIWAAYLNYAYSDKSSPGSLMTWEEFKKDKDLQKEYGFINQNFISLYMYGCRLMSMKYGLEAVMGISVDTLALHDYAYDNKLFSNTSDLSSQDMAKIMTNSTDGLYTVSVSNLSGLPDVDQLYQLSQSQDMYLACLKVSNGFGEVHFVQLSGINFIYDDFNNPIGISEIRVSNSWGNINNNPRYDYLSKQSYSYSEILRWDIFSVTPNLPNLK